MENITAADLINIKDNQHRNSGTYTLAWVIGIVIVLAIIAFFWQNNCNHRSEVNRELGFVRGELQSLVPQLVRIEGQMYGQGGVTQGLTALSTHQQDFERFYFDNGWSGNCCSSGNRGGNCGRHEDHGHKRFNETNTYTLASQAVTVTDTCIC
jgi:hypothetical protein